MKSDLKKVRMTRYRIIIILVAAFITITLMFLLSCGAGVDVGQLSLYTLTIVSSGNGKTFPSGSIQINHGVATNILALPDDTYFFINWTVTSGMGVTFGNAYSDETTVTLIGGNATIQANFSKPDQEIYQLWILNDGRGTTDPKDKINVISGFPTAITAEPTEEGYGFSHWSVESGEAIIGNENSTNTTVVLNSGNATIKANFKTIPSGMIVINGGDEYTNDTTVTLTISADVGSGTEKMMVSNSSDFSGANWEDYATTKSWQIESGDGAQSVYIKFKDYANNESIAYNDSIILDTVDPEVTALNLYNNGLVETGFVFGTASDDNMLSSVEVDLDSEGYTEASGTASWKYQLPTGGDTWVDGTQHTVRLRSKDAAGNYSEEKVLTVFKGTNKDINGDGYSDLATGAHDSSTNNAYIFLGGASAISDKDLSGSDTADTTIAGSGELGNSVALGDVNGDGFADLAVGAPDSNGKVYIFHGSSLGIPNKNLSGSDNADTTIISGYHGFGYTVGLGDVNGDGYADLAVGAYYYNYDLRGIAYIFHGSSSGIANKDLSGTDTADTTLEGESAGDYFGWSLAIGDINGDGYPDLAVGAQGYNSNQGCVYIFNSSASGIANKDLSGSDTADTTIIGKEGVFGHALSCGDVNRDGYSDLAVGAFGAGKTYIFHGSSSGIPNKDLSGSDTANATISTGDGGGFGGSVALGDVNQDGYADLAACSSEYLFYHGRAYIFYSSASGVEGTADTTITGEANENHFGDSVALGDINGDGYSDLAVGTEWYNNEQGRVYLFYSSSSGIANKDLSGSDTADSTLTGKSSSNFGRSIDM